MKQIQQKIGVTVGKFSPPHLGHQYLIDIAARNLDFLYVLVVGSMDDEISVSLRFQWLRDHYKYTPNVQIILVNQNEVMDDNVFEKDELGTVINEIFWISWKALINKHCQNLTHFVSSDMYGKKAAEILGIKWFPIDIERETQFYDVSSLSATKVKKLIKNSENYSEYAKAFKLMIPEAQKYFRKTIAIIGPESSGKSTMVKKLSKVFDTIGVHEYGRTLTLANNNSFNEDDFHQIAKVQDTMMKWAKETSTAPFILTDTEAFVTYLYGKIYLNKEIEAIRERALEQKIDHYILVHPMKEWIDDGWRITPDYQQRLDFFNELMKFCTEKEVSYSVCNQDNFSSNVIKTECDIINFLLGDKQI